MLRSFCFALQPSTSSPETTPALPLPDVQEHVEGLQKDVQYWYQTMDQHAWLTIAIVGLLWIVVFLLRQIFARALLNLFGRLFRIDATEAIRLVAKKLVSPLGWVLTASIGLLLLPIVSLPLTFVSIFRRILQTILILAVFFMLYQGTHLLSASMAQKQQKKIDTLSPSDLERREQLIMSNHATKYMTTILRAILVVIACVSVLSLWIPNITAVVAGVGIGGLLLALAAQDTAANMFASIAIMLDHPFRVGDWIETSDGSGTVESIGLRSTRLRAVDQSLITIPNSAMGSKPIINGSSRTTRQVIQTIMVDPDTSTVALERWIRHLRSEIPDVAGVIRPTGVVHLNEITDLGLILRIAYSTGPQYDQMLQTKEAVNLTLLASARAHGIRFSTRYYDRPGDT